METKTYRNGSRETRAQAIRRMEAAINKLRDDLRNLSNSGMSREIQNSMWQDPFLRFLKTLRNSDNE